MAIGERRGRRGFPLWRKRGNCACAARADKRGETSGFSPLANHPFSLMRRPEAGTAAPFLFLTRTAPKKYGGCCGSSVRAEVRARQRENGCRLSETVYARVTARAGGRNRRPRSSPPWGGSRCVYRDTANGRQTERATHLARGARPYLRKQMP